MLKVLIMVELKNIRDETPKGQQLSKYLEKPEFK